MKKYEMNYNENEKILDLIKNIILSRYPILENRMNILFSYPRPALDININFSKDNITEILFLTGNDIMKCSIPEKITLNGLMTGETITNLINFILCDHEYINNFFSYNNHIELSFSVDMKDSSMRGMGLGIINLSLNFYNINNYNEVMNSYLKLIVTGFYQQIKHTECFKKEYNKYSLYIKEKIINSLTKKDMILFISMLNNEELANILLDIPNERFTELYNNLINQKINNQKKLIK